MSQNEDIKTEENNSVQNQKAKKKAKPLTTGKVIKISVIIVIAVLLICGGFIGAKLLYNFYADENFQKVNYNLYDDLGEAMELITKASEQQINALPKVYAIPKEQYIAPKPKAENYNKRFTAYNDETISVKYYNETHYDALFHFIDVKIAHPSQIRMALAKNKYSTSAKKHPQDIARDVNAVAAIDGCYYNVRKNGILIYQGNTYRAKAIGWDVLLIDSEGDFHIAKDKEILSGDILEKYDIVNSITFGPALVLDGQAQKITNVYGYPKDPEPRAAIAQMGKLHYLLCTVDGRQEHSAGVTQAQLAQVLAKKGCQSAYNLDGGQSATLILGNRVKNSVAYGGQRILGDIVYFATAIDSEEIENKE
ncbi:MAG: phosphodiester glycosidase family protein [Acutalibacteraceae bacterium]